MKIEDIVDIGSDVAGYYFSFDRKKMLKKLGKEILGEKYCKYAVLELRDVSYDNIFGFFAEVISFIFFGWVWDFINWIGALRAYRSWYTGRKEYTLQIIFNTLLCKNSPEDVWMAFFKNQNTKIFYEEFKKYQGLLTPKMDIVFQDKEKQDLFSQIE